MKPVAIRMLACGGSHPGQEERMMTTDLNEEELTAIRQKLEALKIEHRDLDDVIARLVDDHHQDELQIRRLKRRKLMLKDHITLLEKQLVPDIRA
jgi:hypothetical protein